METTLLKDVQEYNDSQLPADKAICDRLAEEICKAMPESEYKIWHRHPVWFLDGNPITGYTKEKRGMRLMFWSGADFDEVDLKVKGEKFKDASIFYNSVDDIDVTALKTWLEKSKAIQWDYKNIVKRKGELIRLK